MIAAFDRTGSMQSWVNPGISHVHIRTADGTWYQNIPTTPGETLDVQVGMPPIGVTGGWPDGGDAGGDGTIPAYIDFGTPRPPQGGYGSTQVLRGSESILCVPGVGGGGLTVAVYDPATPNLPGDDPYAYIPLAAYTTPDADYHVWTPGAASTDGTGANGGTYTSPSDGTQFASSGGGGGILGGACGGFDELLHTSMGGGVLGIRQGFRGQPGTNLVPTSDPALPLVDPATLGGALPPGITPWVVLFWPDVQGWALGLRIAH